LTGRTFVVVVVLALAALSACTVTPIPVKVPAATATSAPPAASVRPNPDHVRALTGTLRTMRDHFKDFGLESPGPVDVLDYGIGDLWMRGIDGTGTTIALVEGWNDPNIDLVMRRFDQIFDLPPADIQTIYPTGSGHLPATCPPGMVALNTYGSCDAWAVELELDVEAAHLMAPYAKIVLAVAPADSEITDDAASQVAPPEMMQAVENISTHHLADVISISDDTGESTYTYGKPEIHAQDAGPLTAAAAGVPLLVGTGDCGVVQNLAVASSQCGNVSRKPDTAAWDDSPWVTAVGGTMPHYAETGERLEPDTVWQEGKLAEGAGSSAVYVRPAYQNGLVPGPMRAVPDIAMDAQLGTSESTPMFAGVLALATQLNHGVVGPVNDPLYAMGPGGAAAGIVDVTSGSNSVTGAAGLSARPGFDAATGWGTVDASTFVPALVTAVRSHPSSRDRAAAALARLRGAAHVSGGTLTASGFLPRHPVRLAVDGRAAATLTADTTGSVTYALHAGPGTHTATLTGMLLTETARF
jgi:subtilase family serine protease